MKAPEQYDPSKPSTKSSLPPSSTQQPAKSPAIPAGMPTITQNHKRTAPIEKKPFQWQFLLPKYWGIWLLAVMILPIIYLPLRWQFWLGRQLGIFIYKIAGSRRRDTLINLKLAFPEKPDMRARIDGKTSLCQSGHWCV